MPIKMIATRRHFVKAENLEYGPGVPFNVADDREADRLVRMRRARRADVSPPAASPPSASPATSAPLINTAALQAGESVSAASTERRRYARRDMRSED